STRAISMDRASCASPPTTFPDVVQYLSAMAASGCLRQFGGRGSPGNRAHPATFDIEHRHGQQEGDDDQGEFAAVLDEGLDLGPGLAVWAVDDRFIDHDSEEGSGSDAADEH